MMTRVELAESRGESFGSQGRSWVERIAARRIAIWLTVSLLIVATAGLSGPLAETCGAEFVADKLAANRS